MQKLDQAIELINEAKAEIDKKNTGNWNTGHRNTGDCNTGFFNITTPKKSKCSAKNAYVKIGIMQLNRVAYIST
ncbi:hypothetical protein [Acinetobacter puyangensis]|uniref:hypothetical protein n=1 Tax=Acinetobacter puyangensis TaxID=1096779 RepID=UPI003A4E4476